MSTSSSVASAENERDGAGLGRWDGFDLLER